MSICSSIEAKLPTIVDVDGLKTICKSHRSPLSFLEQNIILCTLSEAWSKLDIMQYLLPCFNVSWDMECVTFPTQFKIEKLVVLPEEIPTERELQLTKIQQCRYFLKTLFHQTSFDLSLPVPFAKITSFLDCEQKTKSDENMIRLEHKSLQEDIVKLKKEIEELKNKTEDKLLYLTETLSRDEEQALINAWVEQQVAESYVDHRETARVDQVILKSKRNEDNFKTNLNENNTTKDMEHRINQEIESFLLLSKAELQDKLDYWTNRYNTEIEQRDVDLLQLKNRQEEQKENMKTTLELFTARHEEMQILKEEADKREREQEEKTKQNKAASIIQHWWRNYWFMYSIQKTLAKQKKKKAKKK